MLLLHTQDKWSLGRRKASESGGHCLQLGHFFLLLSPEINHAP